ncbi:unnamed protein product [Rhizophagus irregularis]|nr:unnamed protein product [Rhizophagus irregularis]
MSTTKYRGAQEIRKTYEISETLRRWNNQGKISSVRTPGGLKKICYARVSSEKQKEDLDRQSDRNVQTTNSSRTSGQVSTGNARVSHPFWNDRATKHSKSEMRPGSKMISEITFPRTLSWLSILSKRTETHKNAYSIIRPPIHFLSFSLSSGVG